MAIGDCLTLINGRAFKPAEWTTSGKPIIRIQNLNNPEASYNYYEGELPEKFAVRNGDLLFAWSGTPGTSFGAHVWHGEDAWLNQHIFKVLFSAAQFDKQFLRYAINQNLDEYIRAAHGGAGLAHITKGRFEASVLPVPSLAEQRQLVAEIERQFTRLDAGVAGLERVRANLKRYRAAVLKAACEGTLVPTEAALARAEGRDYETGEQLLERILTARRETWAGKGKYKTPASPDTAGLPPLPEGWTWATIEQVVSLVTTGATPLRSNGAFWLDGTIPWVTSGALNRPFIDHADELITDHAVEQTNAKVFAPGTLLVALYGEGKTRGKASELRIAAATNQACAALLFDRHSDLVRPYLKVFLMRNYHDVRTLSSGGVQPNLSVSLIRGMSFPLPPLAEQHRIVAEVERRLSVIDELETLVETNLARAGRLRQSILAKAFSGELVPEEAC
ncbi:MAG: restriction endonuclease subunit S [Planctomycetia bacterium]|nr:restriction endonuclease subunit S [Planctomycetia bacterium]